MKKITEGVALYKRFTIQELTGVVQSETTRSETEVSGEVSGGGGMTYQGTGMNAPVTGNISSKTTRFQTIYMSDDDGGERAVRLVDFVIPCREGHKLNLKGINNELWFDVDNHSTGEGFEDRAGLVQNVFPRKPLMFVAGGIALLIFLNIFTARQVGHHDPAFIRFVMASVGGAISGAVAYGIFWIPSRIVASMRASKVRDAVKQAVHAR